MEDDKGFNTLGEHSSKRKMAASDSDSCSVDGKKKMSIECRPEVKKETISIIGAVEKPRRPRMTDELYEEYFRQLNESGGFHVADFPEGPGDFLYHECDLSSDNPVAINTGERAVGWYNKKNKDRPVSLVSVDKIVTKGVPGTPVYITLRCLDTTDSKVKTYQSILASVIGLGYACRMFRLKPAENVPRDIANKHPLHGCCGNCDELWTCSSKPNKHDWEWCYSEEDSDTEEEEDIDAEEEDTGSEDDEDTGSEDLEDSDSNQDDTKGNDIQEKGNDPNEEKTEPEGDYTLEQVEAYYEQVEESEGFDVEYFPRMDTLLLITPISLASGDNSIAKHVNRAIEFLNKEGAHFKLVRIVKANRGCVYHCSHFHLYITFEAKDGDDGECKTYQARTMLKRGRVMVEEVRLKPIEKLSAKERTSYLP